MAAKATSPGTGNAGMASKSSEGAPAPTNAGKKRETGDYCCQQAAYTTRPHCWGHFQTEGNGREEQQVSSPSMSMLVAT